MTMKIDLRKVFKFDRSVSKLITELEIFKNLLEAVKDEELSKDDKVELIHIAKLLDDLKEEISDKEVISKIKEVFRLIANKVEYGENEEDKILALRGDISYLDYLEAKNKNELIVSSAEEFLKELDEL